MPALLLTAVVLAGLAATVAIAFFTYAHHRYHAVPITARPCRDAAHGVHVDGFDLYVRDRGSQHGGVPVIVLHGGPGHSSLSFKDGLDFLAEHRRVVMYDQRGSGLSEVRTGAGHYSVDALVEELEALRRDVLRVETVDLVGHSAGGALAQRYLVRYPAHVRRLVLVGSTTINNNMSSALVWRVLGPGLYAIAMGLPPADSRRADEWFHADQLESDSRRLFDPADPTPIRDSGPTTFTTWFAVSQSFAGGDRAAQLRELQTPTLVVYGEADSRYTGEPTADQICSLLPNAHSVCVPRSGHWPFLENPDDFRHSVGDFLLGNDSGSPH